MCHITDQINQRSWENYNRMKKRNSIKSETYDTIVTALRLQITQGEHSMRLFRENEARGFKMSTSIEGQQNDVEAAHKALEDFTGCQLTQ